VKFKLPPNGYITKDEVVEDKFIEHNEKIKKNEEV
jgi:hypothetical protein